MDPTDSSWWWTIGLSGTIPALLALVYAVRSFRRTIEHGRRETRLSGAMGTAARMAMIGALLTQDLTRANEEAKCRLP